jgi:hypothetical protein
MGYMLNSLGELPIDEDVSFYIFVIKLGQWDEPLYDMIERNFESVARDIGSHAVIAKGLDPREFYGEVTTRYLGENHAKYFDLLPALLITDVHPDRLEESSLRFAGTAQVC